jgi:molecular chaperone DnaK
MASDNKSLGRFILDGIPPAPRGMPQVEVSFDVDANGILQVKAKDKTTNKEQSIRIEARSGLTDADIERMKKDADMNADTDKKARELAEARNLADQMVYTAEKALLDHGAKIPDDLKKGVQSSIDVLKALRATGDSDGIKNATQALSTEMQKIGQYMQTPPAGGEQGTGDSTQPSQGSGQGTGDSGQSGPVTDV